MYDPNKSASLILSRAYHLFSHVAFRCWSMSQKVHIWENLWASHHVSSPRLADVSGFASFREQKSECNIGPPIVMIKRSSIMAQTSLHLRSVACWHVHDCVSHMMCNEDHTLLLHWVINLTCAIVEDVIHWKVGWWLDTRQQPYSLCKSVPEGRLKSLTWNIAVYEITGRCNYDRQKMKHQDCEVLSLAGYRCWSSQGCDPSTQLSESLITWARSILMLSLSSSAVGFWSKCLVCWKCRLSCWSCAETASFSLAVHADTDVWSSFLTCTCSIFCDLTSCCWIEPGGLSEVDFESEGWAEGWAAACTAARAIFRHDMLSLLAQYCSPTNNMQAFSGLLYVLIPLYDALAWLILRQQFSTFRGQTNDLVDRAERLQAFRLGQGNLHCTLFLNTSVKTTPMISSHRLDLGFRPSSALSKVFWRESMNSSKTI